jgi:hypothetical protein
MTSYTPKGNYPYPVPTDAVTDYPTSAATFAGYVDNLPNRNAIINGQFTISQRGVSFGNPATGTYNLDRWRFDYDGTGGTRNISPSGISTGSQIGGMQAKTAALITLTTGSTGGTYQRFAQRIEDVRTFAGETVTLSFWAYSNATKTVTVRAVQNFGTGGSPSAEVTTAIGTATTYSTTNVRKTFTFNLPALTSKTIGSSENSYLEIHLDFGTQTGVFNIWGVQLEQNNTATALERRPIQQELALCKRYYEKSFPQGTTPANAVDANQPIYATNVTLGNGYSTFIYYSVEKRGATVITAYNASGGTASTWRWYNAAGGTADSFQTNNSNTLGFNAQRPTDTTRTLGAGHWTSESEL